MKISIKNLVDRSHLLKTDIMNRLQISKPTYYKLYNGTSTGIQLDTLEKICKLFKCTPNDVITGYEDLYNDELPDDFITNLEVENNRDTKYYDDLQASPIFRPDGKYKTIDQINSDNKDLLEVLSNAELVAIELLHHPEFSELINKVIKEEENKKDGTQ